MRPFLIKGVSSGIRGEFSPAGDKSIAHRSIIAASLSRNSCLIRNFPQNQDCLSTVEVFRDLGVFIKQKGSNVVVSGKGLTGLTPPKSPIFISESGTTLRLVLGVLAGQCFKVKLVAGRSLSHRPMLRVNHPLRMMGAVIKGAGARGQGPGAKEEYPPIVIQGGNLKGIAYKMPVASAQVKSAVLLAGLFAKGKTRVIEPIKTRDHTERMLKLFKAGIKVSANTVTIVPKKELVAPRSIYIPGDISSAAFFIVAASILPGSNITIKNVCLNPTRIGILKALKRMGANVKISGNSGSEAGFEPTGDIVVKAAKLNAATITAKEIPSLIDELPILMVAACFAKGRTIFEGVGELRVKETDRIRSMSDNLSKMGSDIKIVKHNKTESVIIRGVGSLCGASVKSFGDHRTAMSMVVAGLAASGTTKIDDTSCINKSFPGFLAALSKLLPKS